MLRIKLVRSPIGHTPQNRLTIQALGLRKVRQVVEKEDTPSVRGMIHRVQHLVAVEVLNGKTQPSPPQPAAKPAAKKSENAETMKPVEPAAKTEKPKAAAKPKTVVPKTKAVRTKE